MCSNDDGEDLILSISLYALIEGSCEKVLLEGSVGKLFPPRKSYPPLTDNKCCLTIFPLTLTT